MNLLLFGGGFGFAERFCGLSKEQKPQFSFEGFLSELNNNVLSLPSSNSVDSPAPVSFGSLFAMGRKEEPEGGTKEKDPVVSLNVKFGSKPKPSASNDKKGDKKETKETFSFPGE